MSDKYEVRKWLDKLAEYNAAKDLFKLDKEKAIDSILTPEIKAAIEDINLEYSGQIETVDANISQLESLIKTNTIELGETVKGLNYEAIWNKGRVTWDTKSLDGYLVAHPEIEKFRKQGDPFVSIKKV